MSFSPDFNPASLLAQAATAAAPTAADPAAQQQAPSYQMPILMAAMAAAMYFLLIRPQTRARKEQDKLINALKSGEDIVTTSGILGTVTNVKDKTVIVRIAEGVKIEILKSAITSVVKPTVESAPAKTL